MLCQPGRVEVVVRSINPQLLWFVLKNRALDASVAAKPPHNFRQAFFGSVQFLAIVS